MNATLNFFNNLHFDSLGFSVGLMLLLSGIMLSGIFVWNMLSEMVRLILTLYTRESVSLLVGHLSTATRERQPWSPVLRSLCLLLPWPWPLRLRNAADQLEEGENAASVLQTSNLLPRVLRLQASQALRAGPDSFCAWCDGLNAKVSIPTFMVREMTFIITQVVAFLVIFNFVAKNVMPKLENIFWQFDLPRAWIFSFVEWLMQWKILFSLLVFWLIVVTIGIISAWSWRRTQRLLSGRLLVIGSIAQMPEGGLGTDAQKELSFAELSTASGWKGKTPKELAREVAREDFRQKKQAAWLPALCAALTPIIFAIPVGALVIGIIQLLILLLTSVETFI